MYLMQVRRSDMLDHGIGEIERRIIHLVGSLPQDKQAEALDFIEFLWLRSQVDPDKKVSSVCQTVESVRERLVNKAEELQRQGRPRIEELIKALGGPRNPSEGWNSTDFIRQDRDRR